MSDATPPGPSDQPPPPPPPPPAPDGYGQPPPAYGTYGQPPQPGYGYGYAPAWSYASWGKRVGATLLDGLIQMVVSIPFYIGYFWFISGISDSTDAYGKVSTEDSDISPVAVVLMILGSLLLFAFSLWNLCFKQGRTGYSIGKGIVGIKLIKLETGQPLGAGMSFVRQLAHIIDGAICYIGYLWPLWDDKKQTLADKVMGSVVINQPK